MCAARPKGILGTRPGRPGAGPETERSATMRALRTAAAHVRYLLSFLAAVAFGASLN